MRRVSDAHMEPEVASTLHLERPELFLDEHADAHREPADADLCADVLLEAHEALFDEAREPYALALLYARYRFRHSKDPGVFHLDRRLANDPTLAGQVLRALRDPSQEIDAGEDDGVGSYVVDAGEDDVPSDVLDDDVALADALAFEVQCLKEGWVPLRVPRLTAYYKALPAARADRVVPGFHADSQAVQSLVYQPAEKTAHPESMMDVRSARWPLTVLEDVRRTLRPTLTG